MSPHILVLGTSFQVRPTCIVFWPEPACRILIIVFWPKPGCRILITVFLVLLSFVLKIWHLSGTMAHLASIASKMSCSQNMGGLETLSFPMVCTASTTSSSSTQMMPTSKPCSLRSWHASSCAILHGYSQLASRKSHCPQGLTNLLLRAGFIHGSLDSKRRRR